MLRRLLLLFVIVALVLIALGVCVAPDRDEPVGLAPVATVDSIAPHREPPEPPETTTTAPPPTTQKPVTHSTTPRAARNRVVRPSGPVEASGDLLDRLAACESAGDLDPSDGLRINPAATSSNGRYVGAFQFAWDTWKKLIARLGLDWGPDPRARTYAEQKWVVSAGIPVSSWRGQFPHCSRRLGL